MSNRRLISVAALVTTLMAGPTAQALSLNEVLKRAAAYVAGFHQRLSGIVSEETYRQYVDYMKLNQFLSTTLRSDLPLIKPSDGDRYLGVRDVFEAGGGKVRERDARLENLLDKPGADAHINAILQKSTSYNIGVVYRNINTPLTTLQFLQAANQPRFRFTRSETPAPVFTDSRDQDFNRTPTFRVTSEMWAVSYEERGRDTIIKQPNGRRLPARGRFWINPDDGSVLISELILDGGGVKTTMTVSYQTEPLMGFLVPLEMHESYVTRTERITGVAEYAKFRPIAR